eukprot:1799454-Alexandrium_andersonii.AAC.1
MGPLPCSDRPPRGIPKSTISNRQRTSEHSWSAAIPDRRLRSCPVGRINPLVQERAPLARDR